MYKLIPMSHEHLDLVLAWRNDPKVRDNMYTSHVITVEEHQQWFERTSRDPSRRLLVCLDGSDVPVGVVTFSEIDQLHKRATWAFYSGESTRRGVGSEMECLALDFAFNDLGLEKLNCEVLSFNMPVVEFHRKYGFRVEGIFRAHFRRDGVVHDVYRLAHFRRAWLNEVRPVTIRTHERRQSLFRPGTSHREATTLTRDMISKFAEASGGFSSGHPGESDTDGTGCGGVQVQPMLVAAGFSRILSTVFPGPGTICLEQSLRFLGPVFPDAQIEYFLQIVSRIGGRATLTTAVTTEDGKSAVSGEAEVLLPKMGVA